MKKNQLYAVILILLISVAVFGASQLILSAFRIKRLSLTVPDRPGNYYHWQFKGRTEKEYVETGTVIDPSLFKSELTVEDTEKTESAIVVAAIDALKANLTARGYQVTILDTYADARIEQRRTVEPYGSMHDKVTIYTRLYVDGEFLIETDRRLSESPFPVWVTALATWLSANIIKLAIAAGILIVAIGFFVFLSTVADSFTPYERGVKETIHYPDCTTITTEEWEKGTNWEEILQYFFIAMTIIAVAIATLIMLPKVFMRPGSGRRKR